LSLTNPEPQQVAVLGGGSFGTALANIMASNGYHTTLWFRDEKRAVECQQSRENSHYLPGYKLHDQLVISSDLAGSLQNADVVVVRQAAPYIRPGTMVISATKGIEAPNFTLMSDILAEELPEARIGVLSGPNFAKEIVQNQHTGSVVASDDEQVLAVIPKVFSSKTFRVYTSRDKFGIELAGAIKNIYAIVCGMACALGTGNNTHAMILTRALAEMGRFSNKLGANAMTFLGLAGVGDLILTCSSDLSRNYRVGFALGSGKTLQQTLEEVGQVAEGVNTLQIVKQKADELGVYMPIASGLYAILFEGQDIGRVVQSLMTGAMASDVEFQ
jgi:glycerol-3-phosphate dehydrogenase (NAD(P)+)